jgi:hypothetical protein
VSSYDLVPRGGRVIDPETGTDGIYDVGVNGSTIAAVSTTPLDGRRLLDVANRVVAPGFIDMHSHCFGIAGLRLQALDGITTALELELGVHPIDLAYQRAALEGPPIDYGFSAGWAAARLHVKTGRPLSGHPGDGLIAMGVPEWQAEASPIEVNRVLELLQSDLADGALGVGLVVGYAPRVAAAEYSAVARLAAERGVPTYTHARDLVEQNPDTSIDGAEEIVRAAGETGAHMHYCHIKQHLAASSGPGARRGRADPLPRRPRIHRGESVRLRHDQYQCGVLGSQCAAPAWNNGARDPGHRHRPALRERRGPGGGTPDQPRGPRLRGIPQRGRPHDAGTADQSADLPRHRRRHRRFRASVGQHPAIRRSMAAARRRRHPSTYGRHLQPLNPHPVARDRRTEPDGGDPAQQPVAGANPRRVVPAMSRKGRVQVGADADIVVFDPNTVSDQATYTNTTAPSTGYDYVIVNGAELVSEGRLQTDQLPGKPVRADSRHIEPL